MDYTYTYLLTGILFLALWIVIYALRPDLRMEMLLISGIGALIGPASEILYWQNWWQPITITGTVISIEAVLASFSMCGVGSVIGKFVLKKHTEIHSRSAFTKQSIVRLISIVAIIYVLFFGSFLVLGINSFIGTMLAATLPLMYMWYKRKDLISIALINAILLTITTMIVYTILEFITPGWVEAFSYFKNTPHLIILNVPVDDIIFFFFVGLFLGTFYLWWSGDKLKKNTVT